MRHRAATSHKHHIVSVLCERANRQTDGYSLPSIVVLPHAPFPTLCPPFSPYAGNKHTQEKAHHHNPGLADLSRPLLPRSYVSPRKRAQRTFELLNLGVEDPLPWAAHGSQDPGSLVCGARVEVTDDIREWDYGDYEGVTSPEIRRRRAEQGLDPSWDIWRDGCPGGESPEQVTERLDRLIAEIRRKWNEPAMGTGKHGDVLLVAHGHILRAFAMRWAGKTLQDGPAFLLEAGGVGTLR